MLVCGFNEKMIKGIVLYSQGLYEAVRAKAQEGEISIEEAMDKEIHEMSVFLAALDEEHETLRKNKSVDDAMRELVAMAKSWEP